MNSRRISLFGLNQLIMKMWMIGEWYARTASISYTKVTSTHYQTLSWKDSTWKMDVNMFSRWLQGFLLQFLKKRDHSTNKYNVFYNPDIKKVLPKINGMSYQIFSADMKVGNVYPKLKNNVYNKKHSNVKWEEFLTANFRLRVDTCLSTDSTLYESGRAVDFLFKQ